VNNDDVDFMPDTYAAEVETTPIVLHAILWSTFAFILIALIWANFANLDEVAHAEGKVIPSSQVQIVQNLEGGIISEVLVETGESVTKGQTIIRMDDTRFASSFDEGKLTTQTLEARMMRLQAEIDGVPFEPPASFPDLDLIDNERQVFESRQQELKSSIDILNQQLMQHRQGLAELNAEEQKLKRHVALSEQELALTEPLVETGAVSQVELLRVKVSANEARGRLEGVQLSIPKAESYIVEAQQKISEKYKQFAGAAQAELNEVRTQLSRLTISNIALEDRVRRTDVQSPVDGTVKQIMVSTIGAVIQPGMNIIEIVPSNDTLLIEANIRPSDVAFIHPGQKATVKLTAYDFSIYGGLDSVLELISADTITDETGENYFRIRVRTNENHLGSVENPLPIIPGMIATVDIMTGKKTVMDYLLKPLKRAQATALRER
jgi:adhesin transport system membrane fusion protein